jgi:hypothetical protein
MKQLCRPANFQKGIISHKWGGGTIEYKNVQLQGCNEHHTIEVVVNAAGVWNVWPAGIFRLVSLLPDLQGRVCHQVGCYQS